MNPFSTANIVRLALAEDLGPADLTTRLTVPSYRLGKARMVARQELILSGLKPAAETLRQVDAEAVFTPRAKDGDWLESGDEIAVVEGKAASLLSA